MAGYVVFIGRRAGVYDTWEQCNAQVSRYPGATYRRFPTIAAAEGAYNDYLISIRGHAPIDTQPMIQQAIASTQHMLQQTLAPPDPMLQPIAAPTEGMLEATLAPTEPVYNMDKNSPRSSNVGHVRWAAGENVNEKVFFFFLGVVAATFLWLLCRLFY